jgi:hypothetical protein
MFFDQYVDDEGASRLPLTIQAVAAMDEHRTGVEPVMYVTASARSCQVADHCASLHRDTARNAASARRTIPGPSK